MNLGRLEQPVRCFFDTRVVLSPGNREETSHRRDLQAISGKSITCFSDLKLEKGKGVPLFLGFPHMLRGPIVS